MKKSITILVFVTALILSAWSDQTKVIIDADPAMGYFLKDVDDGLMLLSALSSPELDVLAITTTFGNVDIERSTRKAEEIRDRSGYASVVVIPGAGGPSAPADSNEAARFIVAQAYRYPGEVVLLTAGPLTNLAAALRLDPEVGNLLAGVVAVGGLVETGDPSVLRMPYDLNFGSDPAATRAVFESSVDLSLIHIELCLHFMSYARQFRTLIESAGELSEYLVDQTRSWRLLKQGRFVLWDVVGLNYLLNPDWYDTVVANLSIREIEGPRSVITLVRDDLNGRPVVVPMTMADLDDYWKWLEDRIALAGSV